jgi:acyl-CoA reductase-like NAD-dependent aldehyde dehydrogenase
MQYTVLNPYDHTEIGKFEFDTKGVIDEKISLLTRGKKIQKEIPAFEKANILNRLADLMEKYKEELATLITKEIGKTITESYVEITRTINTTRASADVAKNIEGVVLDSDSYAPKRSKWGIVRREPLGVVLAITPFNFPLNLSMHKIGPAFAVGNSILFKPGPQNYFSGKRLVELCHQAGMPQEMIQFCMPDIPELTNVIKGDDIQAISFTGGVATARAISQNAGFKKLLFELGGNDPMIVMDDADVDLAVATAINQRFGTSGQRCTASKRLFIHEQVYEVFRDKLVLETQKLKVGDPMQADTYVGPVVNEGSAKNIVLRIAEAINDGATLLIGGKREGAMVWPTILENVSQKSELVCDETFGPVIPLFKFKDLEEIIPFINGTGFGLQSGVFTNNMQVIKRLYNELEVGALAVNDGPGFRAEHFPFGGVKNSGLGREGVKYAMEELSYLKTLIL